MDYVVGSKVSVKDGSSYRHYYKLASGRRVYCEDVQAVTGGISIKNNSIRNMTVKANKDFTYVILQSDYPVSYLPEYSSGRLRFDFQNTTSTPGDLSLNKNPLFSSASWRGSTRHWSFWTTAAFWGTKPTMKMETSCCALITRPASRVRASPWTRDMEAATRV